MEKRKKLPKDSEKTKATQKEGEIKDNDAEKAAGGIGSWLEAEVVSRVPKKGPKIQ